jgi:hypothetical protein
MRERIHRDEMDDLCASICIHAETLGLIPLGSSIWWVPGGRYNAPSTPVQGPEGRRFAVSFLPEYKSRDTTRDAHRALTATNKVLAVLAGRARK